MTLGGQSGSTTSPSDARSAIGSEYPVDDELGPTDRERALRKEIADILRGDPEKYRERLADQGKLLVRDRLDLWFGDDSAADADGARREAELREDIDVHRMASEVVIDEIVPPSDLRAELAARFAFHADVEKELPEKKHGTVL